MVSIQPPSLFPAFGTVGVSCSHIAYNYRVALQLGPCPHPDAVAIGGVCCGVRRGPRKKCPHYTGCCGGGFKHASTQGTGY